MANALCQKTKHSINTLVTIVLEIEWDLQKMQIEISIPSETHATLPALLVQPTLLDEIKQN